MARAKKAEETQVVQRPETQLASEAVPAAVLEGQNLMRTVGVEMQQIAVQRPRNEKKILDEAIQELDDFPELLEIPGGVIYSRKVGTDPQTGKAVYARGLSIRAAESLGNRWNNSASSSKLVAMDASGATLFAEFLDYERMIYRTLTRHVSRWYKRANSREMVKIDDQRFSTTEVPKEQSKLIRELFCRHLPPSVTLAYERAAEERIRKQGKPAEAVKKALAFFRAKGVTKEQLASYLDMDMDKPTPELVLELRGLFTALEEGDPTIEELTGMQAASKSGVQPVAGAPTVPTTAPKPPATKPPKSEIPQSDEPKPEAPLQAPKPMPQAAQAEREPGADDEGAQPPDGALDESPDEGEGVGGMTEAGFDRQAAIDRIDQLLEDAQVEKHFAAKCRLIGIHRPFLWADEDDATIKLLLQRLEQ